MPPIKSSVVERVGRIRWTRLAVALCKPADTFCVGFECTQGSLGRGMPMRLRNHVGDNALAEWLTKHPDMLTHDIVNPDP
jgi:hypothetical protein